MPYVEGETLKQIIRTCLEEEKAGKVVHPIGTAICKLASSKKLLIPEITAFKAISGYGLEAVLADGTPISIGLPEYINKKNVSIPRAEEIVTLLSVGSELYLFYFTDQIRPQMSEILSSIELKNGLTPLMLTGDHALSANRVGKVLGITQVFSNLRPEDKLAKVAEFSEKEGLAMVGDGINDAPALARATVGISMGRIGSGAAVDASDVVLLNDDLSVLHWLFSKSKKTQSIVRQNIFLAMGVICLATTPALLGLIPLWVAVLLHEGGTVLVGLNSLRLLSERKN